MSGFSFKGVHSSKFGIYTQDQSRTLLPPKREGKSRSPGAPAITTTSERSITSGPRAFFVRSSARRERLSRRCAGKLPTGSQAPGG